MSLQTEVRAADRRWVSYRNPTDQECSTLEQIAEDRAALRATIDQARGTPERVAKLEERVFALNMREAEVVAGLRSGTH
jgi:hypothetical protein